MQIVKKPAALFDIDGTLYNGALFFDVLVEQKRQGLTNDGHNKELEEVFEQYRSGRLEYEPAMAKILSVHVQSVQGYSKEELLDLARKVLHKNMHKFYPYVQSLIDLVRQSHNIAIVTGEPQYIARAVAEALRVDYFFSSKYETSRNNFTGSVEMQLAYRHEKNTAIKKFLAEQAYDGSLAFGDSEGDIEMLEAVEFGICLHPTPRMKELAEEKGFFMPQDETVVKTVKGLLY